VRGQQQFKASILKRARRIVVKLGSSILTTAQGVDHEQVGRLSAELARLHREGHQLIVVTSGARAAGLARLGLARMPTSIPEQQAAAAIGQIQLMSLYEGYFSDFGKHVGQVLLTAADMEDRTRYLNARHTFEHLLQHGVIPVVNENDSVAIDELKFGDNDRLSALVAGVVDADLLIILTDVAGVYSAPPGETGAQLIDVVADIDREPEPATGSPGPLGSGGMSSKLAAARAAARLGIPTIIGHGRQPDELLRIMNPELAAGTLVLASDTPISNRKYWVAYGVPVRGKLTLDDGAVSALCERGSSLLPSGIVAVDGRFDVGDCVSCTTPDGSEIARGLVAYSSDDCRRIRGRGSRQIEAVLGYHLGDEIIHRDDLVLLRDVRVTFSQEP
jgi:glutamate 5-kinase